MTAGAGGASTDPVDLAEAARRAMREADFAIELGDAARRETAALPDRPPAGPDAVRDLRALRWSSIDNATTRDLDQVEYAERVADGRVRLLVGIADVDAFVAAGSALDEHAARNTTSVYTAVETFAMLPERLSTGLTSLVGGADRLCVVVEMTVSPAGAIVGRSVYRALVHNHAQLAYESVGAWLRGDAPPPGAVASDPALAEQLRLQSEVAALLRRLRQQNGALELETIELQPVVRDGRVVDLETVQPGPARDLIADFMIAANSTIAVLLADLGSPSIRRVVRRPQRWPRLVELAATFGERLPDEASAPALSEFLRRRRAAAPSRFAELSLAVVKLLGAGDYLVQRPGEAPLGHFGLAVPDYSHSTAPNRRYADLVTQRLVKAAIARAPAPYTADELAAIAARCTEREDAAKRVERLLGKQAAAEVLAPRLGETFDALVTGVKATATYVRLVRPPVDGRIVRGEAGLDVGDPVRVTLLSTDVADGYIDFARAD